MQLLEYNYRLKEYLSADGRVPYKFGNLQQYGFHVENMAPNMVGLRIGDDRQVPYASWLETGWTHYISGQFITKHKGWATRGSLEFAEIIAQEEGGMVTYYD